MQVRRKHIGIFILVLVVVFSNISIIKAGGLPASHSVTSSGTVSYSLFKVGVYVTSWDFNEYTANTIGSTFDISQSWLGPDWSQHPEWDYTQKMNQVHALNPNYRFLLYRNVMNIYSYWPDEWDYAKSQGWLLKNINGNYVIDAKPSWDQNYVVDIASSSYQQWIGAKIKSWLDQYPAFDGVMADNGLKYSAQEFNQGCKTKPINPRTGTYFTDTEILDGCAGVLNAIIDAIGTSKLLVPNGMWAGFVGAVGYRNILSKVPRLNGLMSEGCFRAYNDQWYSETDWLASTNLAVWIQDNFLNESRKYFIAGCSANPLPSGATTEQVIMYGFSSMLISIKSSSSKQNAVFFNVDYWNSTSYPIELQLVQKLRSLDMGSPLGNYYKIDSTSVYARDFVKGKVLVNPSGLSYTVPLNGSYTPFGGSVVSGSLTVNAHSGTILFN
jgi:hypothetical protein